MKRVPNITDLWLVYEAAHRLRKVIGEPRASDEPRTLSGALLHLRDAVQNAEYNLTEPMTEENPTKLPEWFALLFAAAVTVCSCENESVSTFGQALDDLRRVLSQYAKTMLGGGMKPPEDWRAIAADAFAEQRYDDAIQIIQTHGITVSVPDGMTCEWVLGQGHGMMDLNVRPAGPGERGNLTKLCIVARRP